MESNSNPIFFPPVWDATMLSTFRSCPQKFFRQYVQHWKPQTESVHLIAGAAFAKGIEVAREAFFIHGMDQLASVGRGLEALIASYGDFDPPDSSAKSLDRMAGALEFYFEHYPLGGDGTDPITLPGGSRGIEFGFALPLPGLAHPQTGDPILYAGRADMIAHAYSGIFIFDEKTTSSLGASWSKNWDMRSQFTGYCWAAKESGIDVAGCIVRGVSILKSKYETQQVLTYRTDYEIERWKSQCTWDISLAMEMWRTGFWSYNLDHSCTEYGGCSLQSICKSPSPEDWLPVYFDKRVWSPIDRKEFTVEEWEESWKK